MNLKLKKPLSFFDLETTGTNIVEDRILEIAIVKLYPDNKREVYHKRINPKIPIPEEASLIHGIYEKDILNAPDFANVAKQINQFFQGSDLAGFNILKFDVPMLIEEFLRTGIDFKIDNRKIIDAQKIFHLMEKRNLSSAYKFYCNKELVNAHSSLSDTLATLEVLNSQIIKYEGEPVLNLKGEEIGKIENDIDALHNIGQSKMIDFAKRMVFNDDNIPVFNFGKHKGKRVIEVIQNEPSYYNWIMNNAFPQDTKKKLTKIKLDLLNQ